MIDVKKDYSEHGNIFSRLHRMLEPYRYLTDIDASQGAITLGAVTVNVKDDSEDSIYHEYRIDRKTCAAETKAIFDYKYTKSERLQREMAHVNIGSSLWYQNDIAEQLQAKFFVVVADNGDLPLTFYRIVDNSCTKVGQLNTSEPEFVKEFWRSKLGL